MAATPQAEASPCWVELVGDAQSLLPQRFRGINGNILVFRNGTTKRAKQHILRAQGIHQQELARSLDVEGTYQTRSVNIRPYDAIVLMDGPFSGDIGTGRRDSFLRELIRAFSFLVRKKGYVIITPLNRVELQRALHLVMDADSTLYINEISHQGNDQFAIVLEN